MSRLFRLPVRHRIVSRMAGIQSARIRSISSSRPGASESFAYILAYVEQGDTPKFDSVYVMNKSVGRDLLAGYSKPGAVDAAFSRVGEYWDALLSRFQSKTPDPHASRMLNIWNQYQCMATFNLSRSASLFETGIGRGMGFRDSNQDLLGFVHMIPERARERILDLAATQLSDGTCYHQYQPLTKKGNAEIGGNFNDDPLWLILSTVAYVKETGDVTILDEPSATLTSRVVKIRCFTIWRQRSAIRCATAGRMVCRLLAMQTGTTASTSTASAPNRTSPSS